jgi:hypothetical protein
MEKYRDNFTVALFFVQLKSLKYIFFSLKSIIAQAEMLKLKWKIHAQHMLSILVEHSI